MNKLITKIVGVALGLSMATGVGVAAVASNRDYVKAEAADGSVSKTAATIGEENEWTESSGSNIGSKFDGFALDNYISVSLVGIGNTGTFWSATSSLPKTIRVYGTKNKSDASITFTGSTDVTIKTITLSYALQNSPSFSPSITSETALQVNKNSQTITMTSGSKNGQIQIKSIACTYTYTSSEITTVNVSYNSNDAESGDVPATSTPTKNSSFNLPGNTGNLVKFGYAFGGWSTEKNGGTVYAAGASFSVATSDVTLYAVWNAKTLSSLRVVDGTPTTTSYYAGSSFDPDGLVVYPTFENEEESTTNVASSLVWTPNPLLMETTSVIGTYPETTKTVEISGITVQQSAKGTRYNPFNVAEALAFIDWTDNKSTDTNDYYTAGFVQSVTNNSTNHSYYLVDDPEDDDPSNAIQAYSRETPTSFSASATGDKVLVKGYMTYYSGKKEIGKSGEGNGFEIIETDPETLDLVLSNNEYSLVVNSEFSIGVTITADYKHKTDVIYTSDDSKFTINSSSVNMASVGDYIITITYDDGLFDAIQKNCTLHVTWATITTVTVSPSTKTIGFNDSTIDLDDLEVTVTPNSNPAYTWALFSAKKTDESNMTANTDYQYDSTTHAFVSKTTSGTVVFHAISTQDANVFGTFTVTITGEPSINLDKTTINGIVSKNSTVEVTSTENMTGPFTYVWSVTNGNDVVSATTGSASSTITFLKSGTATVHVTVTDSLSNIAEEDVAVNVISKLNTIIGDDVIVPHSATWTLSQSTSAYDGGTKLINGVSLDSNISMKGYKNTASTEMRFWSDGIRSYSGNTFEIKASNGATITSISLGVSGLTCDLGTETATSGLYSITSPVANSTITFTGWTGQKITSTITVNYETATEGTEITNKNYTAQKAILDFVASFNSTLGCLMDGTTSGINGALGKWKQASDAFDLALASLTGDDLNDFKAIFKKAVATERDPATGLADTGDDLQNMLARYDYIISKYNSAPYSYGLNDFLHSGTDRPEVLYANGITMIGFAAKNNNVLPVVAIIVSIASLTTIGGYFLLRKKKEEK